MRLSKEQINEIVDGYVADFISQGWSRTQAKSLAWVEYYEFHSLGQYRMGWLSSEKRFLAQCKDCEKSHEFSCADSVRLFIHDHKGHKTWTRAV
jgi:hypothetical protein